MEQLNFVTIKDRKLISFSPHILPPTNGWASLCFHFLVKPSKKRGVCIVLTRFAPICFVILREVAIWNKFYLVLLSLENMLSRIWFSVFGFFLKWNLTWSDLELLIPSTHKFIWRGEVKGHVLVFFRVHVGAVICKIPRIQKSINMFSIKQCLGVI